MKSACATSLTAIALASAASAFQPSSLPKTRPSVALGNSLRDMASYVDDERMMEGFEAFDRNGAFSRSPAPRGGGRGGPDMMDNPNPFARGRGQGRQYTQDGFDPYSAFGGGYGHSQSDSRRAGPHGGMGGPPDGYFGEHPGMMMGGPRGGRGRMNGHAHDDSTLEGFQYDSRTRAGPQFRGQGPPPEFMQRGFEQGPPPMFDQGFDQGPMMGGGGMDPRMMGGGMDMEFEQGGYPGPGGGYGGFEGGDMDMNQMGP